MTEFALGMDISRWDGLFDAEKAKAAGISFVWIKSSQALFTDSWFVRNWAIAKAAGLIRGAYHYLDWSCSGLSQGNYFWNLIKDDPGELPPCVDFEQRRLLDIPRGDEHGHLSNCLSAIKAPKAAIYSSRNYFERYGTASEAWLKYDLWNVTVYYSPYPANTSPYPVIPWGNNWKFWQWTFKANGPQYGTSTTKEVDLDFFNGTVEELRNYANVSVPPVPIPVPTWAEAMTTWARGLGYTGPGPE